MTTLTLFGGVAGVLLLASVVSATLKRAVAHGQPHAVIDNLTARVNAWWVMVAAIAGAFLFGHHGVMVLFYFISFYALREFITLLYTRRADHPPSPRPSSWCCRCSTTSSGSAGTGCSRSSSRSTPSWCCRSWPRWAATRSASSSAPPRSSGA
jgi:hypothetical protein